MTSHRSARGALPAVPALAVPMPAHVTELEVGLNSSEKICPPRHYAGTTTAMRANVTPRAAANQSCVDLPCCGRLLSRVDRALGHAGARHWLGQQVGLPGCVGKSRRGRAGEGRQCPGWASTKRSRWGDGDGYDRRRFYRILDQLRGHNCASLVVLGGAAAAAAAPPPPPRKAGGSAR
eukprot:COSAG06_NODE_8312_length_2206_cov_1.583768_1_plen_178_part_00